MDAERLQEVDGAAVQALVCRSEALPLQEERARLLREVNNYDKVVPNLISVCNLSDDQWNLPWKSRKLATSILDLLGSNAGSANCSEPSALAAGREDPPAAEGVSRNVVTPLRAGGQTMLQFLALIRGATTCMMSGSPFCKVASAFMLLHQENPSTHSPSRPSIGFRV